MKFKPSKLSPKKYTKKYYVEGLKTLKQFLGLARIKEISYKQANQIADDMIDDLLEGKPIYFELDK